MNILEIYQRYQIMPQQADHQLAVAAVGEMICDNWNRGTALNLTRNDAESTSVNKHDVVLACLLHDMGNIVKYNFDAETLAKMPGLIDPATAPHWESVKKEFLMRYGSGSHPVTMKIVSELGVSDRIKELVDCVGFSQAKDNTATVDIEKKICAYSDMRVLPLGVGSLNDRLMDLRVRYANHREGTKERDEFEHALREIERQIFAKCKIKPEEITEEAIAERKEKLKEFKI